MARTDYRWRTRNAYERSLICPSRCDVGKLLFQEDTAETYEWGEFLVGMYSWVRRIDLDPQPKLYEFDCTYSISENALREWNIPDGCGPDGRYGISSSKSPYQLYKEYWGNKKPKPKRKGLFMFFGTRASVQEAVVSAFEIARKAGKDEKGQLLSVTQQLAEAKEELAGLKDELATARRNQADEISEARRKLKDEMADERRKAKYQLDEIKREHANEKLDFEFLSKKKSEMVEIAAEKKEIELMKKFEEQKAELQQKFYDDTIKLLDEAKGDMNKIYSEILKRMPNVNWKHKTGDTE